MSTDDDTPNPDEIVEQHWPYDGPHTPETVATALAAVAELVRYGNNASQHPKNLGDAPQGWRTLGGMNTAPGDMSQLLGQLATWAEQLSQDPTVRHDAWRAEPAVCHQVAQETAAEAATSLRQAGALARQLHEAVAAARQQLSHLFSPVNSGSTSPPETGPTSLPRAGGPNPATSRTFCPSLPLWWRPQVGPKLAGKVEPGTTGKDTHLYHEQ